VHFDAVFSALFHVLPKFKTRAEEPLPEHETQEIMQQGG
jgi:hypothetical protein